VRLGNNCRDFEYRNVHMWAPGIEPEPHTLSDYDFEAHLNEDDFSLHGSATWTDDHVLTMGSGSGYVESLDTYSRPIAVSVEMRQVSDTGSPECGVIALFPTDTGRHSGYNAGIGWWASWFGTGLPGAEQTTEYVHGEDWATVIIDAAADGNVYFYLNGELQRTVADTQFNSGVVRLGNNCRDFEYRNVHMWAPGSGEFQFVASIGSGDGPTSIDVPYTDIACPSDVSVANWLGTDTYGDTFAITVEGSTITATRTDTGDLSNGWGMNLEFMCSAGTCSTGFDECGVCGGDSSSCGGCGPEDLDNSGQIDFNDLVLVLSNWDTCCEADLDGNGNTSFSDLLRILSTWGSC